MGPNDHISDVKSLLFSNFTSPENTPSLLPLLNLVLKLVGTRNRSYDLGLLTGARSVLRLMEYL